MSDLLSIDRAFDLRSGHRLRASCSQPCDPVGKLHNSVPVKAAWGPKQAHLAVSAGLSESSSKTENSA